MMRWEINAQTGEERLYEVPDIAGEPPAPDSPVKVLEDKLKAKGVL